jgi:hypothetical protein
VPNCSVGNGTVNLTVVDNGEPGSSSSPKPDQIGFTIRDQYNTQYYATNSNVNVSGNYKYYVNDAYLNSLDGGNIQVHVNGAVSPAGTLRDEQATTTMGQKFEVTATPNPSFSYFSLHINGNSTGGLVNLKVTDVLGRVVESRQHLAPVQTLRIGTSYLPGIYIVEVQQGDTLKQLKLVKQ